MCICLAASSSNRFFFWTFSLLLRGPNDRDRILLKYKPKQKEKKNNPVTSWAVSGRCFAAVLQWCRKMFEKILAQRFDSDGLFIIRCETVFVEKHIFTGWRERNPQSFMIKLDKLAAVRGAVTAL